MKEQNHLKSRIFIISNVTKDDVSLENWSKSDHKEPEQTNI